jgi:aspartate/methionine/tyrosine aminotransferase
MSLDFPSFRLLHWIVGNQEKVKYDLASNNMPPYVPDFDGKLEEANLAMCSLTGTDELKDTISDLSDVEADNILVTNGASEANFLVCAALLSRRDEVLVERPFYEPLASIPQGLGSKVRFIDRKPIDFPLDLTALRDSITPATKLLVITNLHNPSGAQISDVTLKELSEIAGERNIHVLCDEIFRDFAPSPSKDAFHFGEGMISTMGMSKYYGTSGLRVGWILAEKDFLERCRRVREHTAVSCSSVGEAVAVAVLKEREKVKARNTGILNENSRTMVDWASKEGIEMMAPAGANMCFPKLQLEDTLDFCKRLLDNDVLVSPGEFFGLAGHIRIGFCCENSVLQEGLEILSDALHEFTS